MTDCGNNLPGDDFPNADSLIQAIFDAQEEEAAQNRQREQSNNPGSLEAAGESQASSSQKSKSMVLECCTCVFFMQNLHVYIIPTKSPSYMKQLCGSFCTLNILT